MRSSPAADFLLRPFRDAWRGLDRCLDRSPAALLATFLGLLAGWWIYVPAHELLHAAACLAAGGEVERLEISPLYGGALLARWLPFVVPGAPGSEYAGRLSGFDPGGSDLVYLATDLGPFVLALFPGVWGLRRAAAARQPLAFGLALPFALAPLLSATGDAYEIGSLLATNLPPWSQLAATPRAPWGGAALAALAGLVWAWSVYGLGGFVARTFGQPPVAERPTFSGGAAPAAGDNRREEGITRAAPRPAPPSFTMR
jgi:hypothetical protein